MPRRRRRNPVDAATRERNAASVAYLRKRYRALVRAHPHGAISEKEYLARNLPAMLGPRGKRYRNPGRRKHSAKWDRCVAEVARSGTAADPYAVCQAELGRRKRRRNPGGPRMYQLVAIKGTHRLVYVGGNKFAKRGPAVTFATEEAARATGRLLETQFPVLQTFTLKVDRV
jgi:hypothetical protein